MLLQSLVNYYEILTKEKGCDIPKRGYSKAKVSYALIISKDGKLLGILPLKRPNATGKKEIAQEMDVPEQVKRAVGVSANFSCDNSSYVLGFDNKGKKNRSKECFEAFKILNQQILKDVDCEEARAVCSFLEHWDTDTASENPIFTDYLEDFYKGANFVFILDGKTQYIHQNEKIKQAWDNYKNATLNGEVHRCLVTGELSKIARLHPSIRGLRGGQPMGNTLISFNDSAYESYGNVKAQGLNAPVGEYATFAYGTVLNYMLADTNHRMTFGDATIVFWAECPSSNEYQDRFSLLFNPDELEQKEKEEQTYIRDSAAIEDVKAFFMKIANGSKVTQMFSVKEDVKFYVLALSPNAARISIRFILCNEFRSFCEMLSRHYKDLAIEKRFERDSDSIPMWKLLNETVAPSSKDKASSPLLTGSVLRSILMGSPYPAALFQLIMIRIRAEKEINYVKAAIIKAYLSRCIHSSDYQKEGVLEMSLNTQSKNKAYVLGRLFAALEKAQKDANPNIKATIKDRYFTSSCANPAQTFPVLLKLASHHISKAQYGICNDNNISEILQMLEVKENPFPKRLSLEEQGIFVLGYYHQRNQYFTNMKTKSELKNEKETVEGGLKNE